MWLLALLAVAIPGWAAGPPAGADVVLACAPASATAVNLKLVVLNPGAPPSADAEVLVTFVPPDGGPPLELPAPGPRSLVVPLAAGRGAPDHTAVVDLGEVSLAPPCPAEVLVQGGLSGSGLRVLGTLRQGRDGAAPTFARAYPGADGEGAVPGGRARLFLAAACEPLEDGQFLVKLACLNCGEAFAQDQDLFLHFELAPTGSDLGLTTALGLYPSGRATDSAAWSESDIVVVSLGPYTIPDAMPEFVYLRAGLYDRQGDGARVTVAGPDDTHRALLGRLVTREGRTSLERAPLPGTQVPADWDAPAEGVK